MLDDERAPFCLDAVVQFLYVPRHLDDTQQLCVGRVILT